jgi:hypothetical protein
MRKNLLLLLCFLGGSIALVAQPSNDECDTPIVISDVSNFCSPNNAYTNVGATPSSYGPATCFAATQNDVWFAFTAIATDVTITIRGNTFQAPGGTLVNPQVAIYSGTCGGTINQLECGTAQGGSNVVEAYQGGLFVGSTYLVRVQGVNGSVGTFQFCINNYNPPVEPTSDCPTASILCDKSSFVVQQVTGGGNDLSELDDATCFFNGSPVNNESNSTWFTWICSQSGTLEFTLTPLNIPDDLDFVVYRLPNGVGDCSGKIVERCMASGSFNFPSPCMGPTGLMAGETDVSEDAGCQQSDDNAWLAPLDMIAGETYALVVNNFSTSGNGFSIEFGGTGEFLGPEAAFATVPGAVCLGTEVQVFDASTFALGAVTGWEWSFGADAVPQTATGQGPHAVTFNNPGVHPVVMTIETDLGCKVTDIQTVEIYPDVEVDTLIAEPDCNGGTNGAITINNITSGTPPYQFSWENGPFTSDNTLAGLGVGVYNLVIRDANNCETDLDIQVDELTLTVSPDVTPPLCTGDANGVITLNVTNGTGPYQFDWGAGYIPNNSQSGFSAGVYTIEGLDATLCKGTFEVTVTDNPPVTLSVEPVDISCFGANDGIGIANPAGGVGNFTYLWSDTQTESEATGLGPGTYSVTISDANGCTETDQLSIIEPPDLFVDLLGVVDLLCNGVSEGEITVQGGGGTPPYTYSADGSSFQQSSTLTGLAAGPYWVQVQDASGCIDSVAASLTQPPPLIVAAIPSDTTLDLGYSFRINTITGPSGRPVDFLWMPGIGLSCTDCPDPTATAIDDQVYVVKITDETGCMAFDTVQVFVNKDRPVYTPNIIAPGKTYPNTHFTLFGNPAADQISLLRIYDRWGSLVFEKSNFELNEPNLGWDGTYKGELVDGVFAFYALVRFVDGVELTYEGDITVVR